MEVEHLRFHRGQFLTGDPNALRFRAFYRDNALERTYFRIRNLSDAQYRLIRDAVCGISETIDEELFHVPSRLAAITRRLNESCESSAAA